MSGRSLTSLNIAAANFRRKPFRAIFMAAFVALLALMLAGCSLIAYSLINGLTSIAERLGAEVLLVPKGYEREMEGVLLRGEPGAFYFEGGLAQKLSRVEGISKASPQLFIATMDSSHCAFPVQLIGYDPETDFVIAPWLEKRIPGALRDGEIVIGNSIVATPGDKLRFFDQDYLVAARLDKTGLGFDTSIFFNLKTARLALKQYIKYSGAAVPDEDQAVSVITADLTRGYDSQAFARNIRDDFRQEGVRVIMTKNVISKASDGLTAILTLITAAAAILWVGAAGGLAIMFAVALNERKREFGLYRALGATRKKLIYIVLTEAALISLVGAVTGIAILVLLVFPFAPLISAVTSIPHLQPSSGAIALILTLSLGLSFLAGTLASVYSAAKIGRLATSALLQE